VIAASGPTALWYTARSTGYVSLLLLTAILVLGIITAMRVDSREWPRFLSQAVHRNLSLLVLVFLAIHILTSIIDPFAGIAALNTVVPFTGSYRPVWLGLGVLSMELMVALTITSLLRHRIGFRLWRVIHWAAYAAWPLALVHTLGTGSDVRSAWALILTLGCVAAVVFALVWRLTSDRAGMRPAVRGLALVATAVTTIALAGFAAAGPLHSGWAKSAGTPARLLAASDAASPAATPTPVPAPTLATNLRDPLTGTVAQNGGTVQVDLSDTTDATLKMAVAVRGQSTSGRLLITKSGVTVCDTTASVVQDVVATCGRTSVDISLGQQPDGSITGQLVTGVASQ
jgi:methionine sulfoxide reductase heme-binding subunit